MFKYLDREIKHDKRGYYTLYIDGEFMGNFDTFEEACHEYYELKKAA